MVVSLTDSKLSAVFEAIDCTAKDWKKEALGRIFQAGMTHYEQPNYKLNFNTFNSPTPFIQYYPKALDTFCVFTSQVISLLLLGPEHTYNPLDGAHVVAGYSNRFKLYAHRLSRVFNDSLIQLRRDQFFVYTFNFHFPIGAHVFTIIQYKNMVHEPCYRIYQSYLGEYSLEEYLACNSKVLSQDEIDSFFRDLKLLVNSRKWSENCEAVFKLHFLTASPFKIGDGNKTSLFVDRQKGSLRKFKHEKRSFHEARHSSDFPLFRAVSNRKLFSIFCTLHPLIVGDSHVVEFEG